jgi:hypothetical protein
MDDFFDRYDKYEDELRMFSANKNYSKANEMIMSEHWNNFYTGMIMKSELSLKKTKSMKTKIFSDLLPKLDVIVSREAQIHMHIWYSILKDKKFFEKEIPDYYKPLLFSKAKHNWKTLVAITKKLILSEDLHLTGTLKSEELREYGTTMHGESAWRIKQDKFNRFVYVPQTEVGRSIKVLDCMFHYDDPPLRQSRVMKVVMKDNVFMQYIFRSIYTTLTFLLSNNINSDKFRSVVKVDYLSEMFKGNSKYINLI